MNVGIILLYALTVVSFGPPLFLAGFLWRRGHSPLALNYLRFQSAYLVFLLALFAAFLLLTYLPEQRWPIEVFFDTAFFLLYATAGWSAARFLTELIQRRWEGPVRRLTEAFALLGVVTPLAVNALVFDGTERALVLRVVLNIGYFALFLVGLTALFVRAYWHRRELHDEWKRRTVGAAFWIYVAAVPAFVVDAFWPVLQDAWGLIPRGLNVQVLPLLVWNVYFTVRWFSFPVNESVLDDAREPSPALMDLMTAREREIALLLLQGRSNQEICDALGVRMGTTKNHIYNIFNKTGASSRQEFCRMLKS